METENYYLRNLETGKLNIHTTKEFYQKLELEQKKVFSHYCLWGNKQRCWVSKAKAENTGYLKSQLTQMGFDERTPVGEKLSFEQQVEKEQRRAEDRAERAEDRKQKALSESDRLYDKAKEMASVIPFGQPILVGHHSEQRDRNYRERIHNTFGKAFAEQDKAAYYEEKAENAAYTASGKKFNNPKYLNNRIKECEKHIRVLELRLQGKMYRHSPEREVTPEARGFYNGRITEEQEKLQFFYGKMLAINPDWKPATKKAKGKTNGQAQ